MTADQAGDPDQAKGAARIEGELERLTPGELDELSRFWSDSYRKTEHRRTTLETRAQFLLFLVTILVAAAATIAVLAGSALSSRDAPLYDITAILVLALIVASVGYAIRTQRVNHLQPAWLEFSEAAHLAGSDESVFGGAGLQRRRAAETYLAAERSRSATQAAAASLRLAELFAGGALAAVLAMAFMIGASVAPATATGPSLTPSATHASQATGSPPSSLTGSPVLESAIPTSPATASPSPSPSACPTALVDGTISTIGCVLPLVTVAIEDRTGYDRKLFRLWIDENHDGCNTRQEVLIRDAVVAPFIGSGCTLAQGEWFSQYDGLTFTDPARLDIDHVVPLAEAWDSGARGWEAPERQSYANDLDVNWALLAVSASANRSKGDRDPAEWLRIRSEFVCEYLADWLAVKVRWGLSIDELEKAAIAANVECSATTVEILFGPSFP